MSSAVKLAPGKIIDELLNNRVVLNAFRLFEIEADAITEEQIQICSVPASPFGEEQRAKYLRDKFLEIGLTDVNIDAEGNCLGFLKGEFPSPLMVVSAHLDTVFPPETDFTVHKKGERLFGPGISDDGCGLIALNVLARVLVKTRINGSILFVGTVGEEGEGNLRGVRYLLSAGAWAGRIDSFLSFDGHGIDRITNQALGSRRYRVRISGVGGHSWGDFGIPNPVHALGRAISRLANYPLPKDIRTTFNVGKISGGASINSIARDATMDADLRSSDEDELTRLDAYFRRSVTEAVEQENTTRRPGDLPLELDLELVGERPGGLTSPQSLIVELAQEATRVVGVEPQLEQSSTDSNFPMSIGIPAITLGAGGSAGSSHTLDEWFEPTNRDKGLKRGLLTILGMVGLAESS